MITLFNDPFFMGLDKMFETPYQFSPKTNVRKTENEYKVIISVPGLTKDDLEITTKDGVLKISYNNEEKDDTKHFISSFVKTYSLPEDVKEKDIVGKVENGVLELTLPIDRKKLLWKTISLN